MSALAIIGIVLGAILLIILLILALPVYVMIKNGKTGDEIRITYRLLWMVFGEEPNPDSLVVKTAVKLLNLERIVSTEAFRKEMEYSGLNETVAETVSILLALLDRVVWILPRCRVTRLKILSVSGGNDAAKTAIDYGIACSVIYPVAGWIQDEMKMSAKAADINVLCNFNGQSSIFEIDTRIKVRIWQVLRALIHVIRVNVKEKLYRDDRDFEAYMESRREARADMQNKNSSTGAGE